MSDSYSNSPIVPTHDQFTVLYVIIVYAVVLFGLWTIPGARMMIIPLKLFAIGWHELCHAIFAIMTGGTITRMSIDPVLGGCTTVRDGHPASILCAGYVGSTLMGGLFILGGFDTLAAKLLSFVAGVGLIAPLSLVRDKLTILLTIVYEGLLVGFWFIDHAQALRWYMLFLGMIHILYVICTSTLPYSRFPDKFTSQRGHNRRKVFSEASRLGLHPILTSLQGGPSTRVGDVLDRISARFTYRIYIPWYCGLQAHAGSNERRSRAFSTNIAYISFCVVCYPHFVVGCRLACTLVFLLSVDRYRMVTQCHKLLPSSLLFTFSLLSSTSDLG